MSVTLQSEPFDPGALTNAFIEAADNAGAAVTFTGLVRSTDDDPIVSMALEHYPALARRQLEALHAEAMTRFHLRAAAILHRYGTLYPGEPIVHVMTLAPHRHAAFEGANFIMDTLKTNAPFWKKEERATGTHWVEARESDNMAAARWE